MNYKFFFFILWIFFGFCLACASPEEGPFYYTSWLSDKSGATGVWGALTAHGLFFSLGWGSFGLWLYGGWGIWRQRVSVLKHLPWFLWGLVALLSLLPMQGPLGHAPGGFLGWWFWTTLEPYVGFWGILLIGILFLGHTLKKEFVCDQGSKKA